MDKASEAILALKPVTFRYKKEIDPDGVRQFGLVAEEVEKVNPDLVVRDKQGKPYTVCYDAVNAMLLNEFLKEHRRVQEQASYFESKLANQQKEFEARLAQQQTEIEDLTAAMQKVGTELEVSSPRRAPPLAVDDQ
jgi:predicted ribosome quality control (RQC) complex YloA/Tae2 family protein